MRIVALVLIFGVTFLNIYLIKIWMKFRLAVFWSMLLWLPYCIVFVLGFAYLFPNNNPVDNNPASGLIIIGATFVYPIFVGFTIGMGKVWSTSREKS